MALRMPAPPLLQILRLEQQVVSVGRDRRGPLAQLFGKRDPEPLLAAADGFGRQPVPQGLFEQPFSPAMAQLEAARQPPAELDQVIVEKDGARFQRHHHAGAIDLGEDVVLQIEVRIELEGLVEEIAAADRKSTRLNSSHSQISYAVFCLKQKTYNLG